MDIPKPMLDRFRKELDRLGLPGGARGILVGASGGPDSTALCRLFAALRQPGWPPLWAGHVHHGMRGAEADGDSAFVRGLARVLGLGFLEERVDVPRLAVEGKLSREAAARAARLEAFSRWARERPIDLIALAHTADDQAETVLLRLFRRAGLRGLGGMAPARPLAAGQPERHPLLVRPLLGWRREEVLSLLSGLGQEYREDSTNRDLSILRNRVRHRLLPLLRSEFEPGIDEALVSVAGFARGAAEALEELARESLEKAIRSRSPDSVVIDAAALAALPAALRRTVLRIASLECAEAGGKDPAPPLEGGRLERLLDRLESSPEGKRWLSPESGLEAELRDGALVLRAGGEPPRGEPPPPVVLPLPGTARWGPWEIRAEPASLPALPEGQGRGLVEVVDRATLTEPLEVRGRHPGDRLRPLGAPGRRKLKDLLRERGVDPRRRSEVPLVVDARGIVWVVGHRIADPHRLRPESRELVRLSAVEVR